ncbi:MAG: permease-like cell division protein FtsX [Nitrosomonas sp.]|nr:ABC transporter permease [Nitrosomonas sp.]MCC7135573.1 ABC transporter permease [Nitrosomonas sp.]
MIRWLRQHGLAVGHAFEMLIGSPASSVLSIVVMGIVLSFPAGILLTLDNLRTVSGESLESPQLSVLMNTDAASDDIERINANLEKMSAIAHFQFISKEIALQQLQQETELAEIMRNLEQNPLPDVFAVNLGNVTVDEIEALRTTILAWPKIAHVLVDTDWARKLDAILSLGRIIAIMLAILFGAALVFAVFNMIRLQILTRSDEIEVSRLVGATNSYIRRPFLYFGAIQGLAGALLAWLILAVSIAQINKALFELARLYETTFKLDHFVWLDSLILLVIAIGLGWLGAYVSVTRYLLRSDNI